MSHRSAYEEEILESIVIPTFVNIAYENDAKIRTSVGELLLKFVSQCDSKRSIELLDIVEKLLNRPFDRFTDEKLIVLKNDDELSHITHIVDELIRVRINKCGKKFLYKFQCISKINLCYLKKLFAGVLIEIV